MQSSQTHGFKCRNFLPGFAEKKQAVCKRLPEPVCKASSVYIGTNLPISASSK
jgi:hypothetical protein